MRQRNVPFVWIFLLSLLQASQISFGVQDVGEVKSYHWKTGQWSNCVRRTKCGDGNKTRKVLCLDRFGNVTSNSNCSVSVRPVGTEKCFAVCEQHKFVLSWRIGHWSRCKSNRSFQCNETSTPGVAYRVVECLLSSTNLIVDNEACEYFWEKPESEMNCSLDCRQECVTAKTDVTCQIHEGLDLISWKTEVDDLLVAPGTDDICENFSSKPLCQKHRFRATSAIAEDNQTSYKLKIGSWSDCETDKELLPEDFKEIKLSLRPVIGWSKRNVTCVNDSGIEVDMSFCNQREKQPLLRRCVVSAHCVVSPWSEWNVLEEGCVATDGQLYPQITFRNRTLIQMPVGVDATPCPPIYEERSIEIGLPTCEKYKWYPLEWSDCQIMIHGIHNKISILKPTCGDGLQYRNLTCLRKKDMVPVDKVLCKEPPPPTITRCQIPCKRDCEVSHWARWGPCMPLNKTNFLEDLRKGYNRRVREILVNPTNGGKPCPHLEELNTCLEVEIFTWKFGKWSKCQLSDPQAVCGEGKKSRDFTCVKHNGEPIDNFMCGQHVFLIGDTADCRIPCPNDCILSEWSQWSDCSEPCYTNKKEGFYWRNRTLLAVPGIGGEPCKTRMKDSETCNTYSCSLYKYTTTNWGPCIPLQNNDINQVACGPGVQTRKVNCKKGKKPPKTTEPCDHLTVPELTRECYVPCPVDCRVSNFSDWTTCKDNCNTSASQYRYRIILQSSRHGGKPCPDALQEARPCSSTLNPNCEIERFRLKNITYGWTTGTWSNCQLPFQNQTCGVGFQIRNVSCRDSSKRAVEAHLCLPFGWKTLPDGPIPGIPPAMRSCEVTCSSGCALSIWSSWSPCIYSYAAKRSRRRELVGGSEYVNNCIQKFKLLEEEHCPTIPYKLIDPEDSNWMSCILETENRTIVSVNGQLVSHSCGSGYEYKMGLRMTSNMAVGPGLERDLCWTDCPVDCQMSVWSEWTECNVPCGQGFRERQRRVLVPANAVGRPCPETVNKTEIQRDVCNIMCMDYYWLPGGWNSCELHDRNSACGNGTHYRFVRCMNKRTQKEVEESKCDPVLKPQTIEPCRIYCPGECVVSPWRITKKCTEPCSSNNTQEMQRTVYREPNSTAEPCQPLVKHLPCVLNLTCHHHTWVLGPWGSCVLTEGAYCGEGVRKRPLICLRSDGRQVDPMQCEKTHKPLSLSEPLSKPCYTPCPVDCIMSQWSAWNTTSCSACGTVGIMTRTRVILENPTEAGQPCPSDTIQRKPCEFKSCYHWRRSMWSQCDLEGADCGFGVRRRVVECIRFDNLKVDRVHCLVVNVTFPINGWMDPAWLASAQDSDEEELCHIPCPGDDILSEWTAWKHCQKNCRIGQKVGYQTSSRHLLFLGKQSSNNSYPMQLWRTKPCWSDDCDVFAWKLRNNSYICERKDGLVVEGGCTFAPFPCFPTCEAIGGRCEGSTGICYCENAKGEKTILGPSSTWCGVTGRGPPRAPADHSAPTPEIKYYPDDNQVSFWMYAMISIGTAFVIFVAVTVYLMCRSSLRQRTISVERQPSVRRRLNEAVDTS